jgi:hypothetical protein
MTMQAAPQTQALILLFKTMTPETQKEFKEWINDVEPSSDFEEEKIDFYRMTGQNLNLAYGDDEPEYSENDFLELNPNFNPQ